MSERSPERRQPALSREAEEALGKASDVHGALAFPENVSKEDFAAEIKRALEPVPSPQSCKNPTPNRVAFLEKDALKIQECEKNLQFFIVEIAKEFEEKSRQPLAAIISPLLFGRIADLIVQKQYYRAMHAEEQPKTQSDLPMYLAVTATVLAEQKFAGSLPLGGSGEWTSKSLRGLDIQTQRGILRADRAIAEKLSSMGIKNAPPFAQVLLKAPPGAAKVLQKILEKATPNSVYDIILMAYFLYEADDKMEAAMHFGLTLAEFGLSDIVVQAAVAEFPQLALIGKPIPLTIACLVIVFLLNKTGMNEAITNYLKSVTDPAWWDAGGNVADMMVGSALIGQAGEIGYMTGLRSVDPELDQRRFLSQKIMKADWKRGQPLGNNFAHTTGDWDEQVEAVAATTEQGGNPVQAKLLREEKIMSSPGGETGWAKRQSIEVYQLSEQLKGFQDALNGELKGLGIIENERGAGMFDLRFVALDPQVEGDVGIRTLLQKSEQYQKIERGIEALRKPKEGTDETQQQKQAREKKYADVRDLHNRCVRMAEQLAKTVSMHTHLGTYDKSWTELRKEGDDILLPKAVEEGMIYSIAYATRRREALNPASYPAMSRAAFSKNVAETFRYNRDSDPWPDILGDPLGWVKRYQTFARNAETEIRDVAQMTELETVLADIGTIVKKDASLARAIEPIVAHVQGKKDDVPPVLMERMVMQAMAEALPEEDLKPTSRTSAEEITRALGTAEKSEDLERLLQQFCAAGPEFSCNKGFGLAPEKGDPIFAYSVRHRLYFDRATQSWMVDVSSSISNPRNHGSIGQEYMGRKMRLTFDRKDIPGRAITLDAWSHTHPAAAKSIETSLQWHEQWIEWARQKIASAKAREASNDKEQITTERTDREKACDNAKQHPLTWQKYPRLSEGTVKLRSAGEVPYEYVAYIPGEKAHYIYLQTPEIDLAPAWRSGSGTPEAKAAGYTQLTRIGVRGEGEDKIRRYTLGANFRTELQKPGLEHLLHTGLTMPIADSDRLSVRKLLALYQGDALHLSTLEELVIPEYQQYKDPLSKERFLRHLDTQIRSLTDAAGKDGKYLALTPTLLSQALARTKELMNT